jgi:hypothetical protein
MSIQSRTTSNTGAAAVLFVVICVLISGCHSSNKQTTNSPPPPDLAKILEYQVLANSPAGELGYIFYSPGNIPIKEVGAIAHNGAHPPTAAVIRDKQGRIVWQYVPPATEPLSDLQVQSYQGNPVLTWTQGSIDNPNQYIADSHYHVIKTLALGQGLQLDHHEFRLVPGDRALMIGYKSETADLTSVGGPKDGEINDCVAEVIDIATGNVVTSWDAAQHVPISDTYVGYGSSVGSQESPAGFDPYHMNSVALDPAGNLVISIRHTSAIYDVNPTTGAINWQLGGKHSTFSLGKGVQFAFQHDVEMSDPSTVRFMNNNGDGVTTDGLTSIQWVHLDFEHKAATLIRNQLHPGNIGGNKATGNVQQLPDGDVFGSWGSTRHISEFAPDGTMVYDAVVGVHTPRAFLSPWTGAPDGNPNLTIAGTSATAEWNGATNVAQWRLLQGQRTDILKPASTVPWNGLDTVIPISGNQGDYYQLQALDASGAVIGLSPAAQAP